MPIVQAKCENCGGVLAVDNNQKAAICPFCNTPYVVQDAINNYNITNNVNVGAGAVVNVYGKDDELQKEQMLKNAETFYRLSRYTEAEQIYNEFTKNYPNDYRGWWGKANLLTHQFTINKCGNDLYTEIRSCVDSALKVADENVKKDIEVHWNNWRQVIHQGMSSIKAEIQKYREELKKEDEICASLEIKIKNKSEESNQWNKKEWDKNKHLVGTGILIPSLIVGILFLIAYWGTGNNNKTYLIIGVIVLITGISIRLFRHIDHYNAESNKKELDLDIHALRNAQNDHDQRRFELSNKISTLEEKLKQGKY